MDKDLFAVPGAFTPTCSQKHLLGFVEKSATSSSAQPSASAFIKKTISSHNIVIFSKSYCPYCREGKSCLQRVEIPHVVELDERDDGWNIQDALSEFIGKHTVPQVFINGKHIGGSDGIQEKILDLLC